RLLPIFSRALASVAQVMCTRGHSLTEFPREAVQRLLRHAQSFESFVGESNAHPCIGEGTRRVRGRSHHLADTAHQLASGFAIIDAQRDVRGYVRRRPRTQHTALNVVEFKLLSHSLYRQTSLT